MWSLAEMRRAHTLSLAEFWWPEMADSVAVCLGTAGYVARCIMGKALS